jgi:hypothetical protein
MVAVRHRWRRSSLREDDDLVTCWSALGVRTAYSQACWFSKALFRSLRQGGDGGRSHPPAEAGPTPAGSGVEEGPGVILAGRRRLTPSPPSRAGHAAPGGAEACSSSVPQRTTVRLARRERPRRVVGANDPWFAVAPLLAQRAPAARGARRW